MLYLCGSNPDHHFILKPLTQSSAAVTSSRAGTFCLLLVCFDGLFFVFYQTFPGVVDPAHLAELLEGKHSTRTVFFSSLVFTLALWSSSGPWSLTLRLFVLPLSWHDVFWADSDSTARSVCLRGHSNVPVQYALVALQSLHLVRFKFLLLILFNLLCVHFRQRATRQSWAKQPRLLVPSSQTESSTWNCRAGDTDEEIHFIRCRQLFFSFCLSFDTAHFKHHHYHHEKRWSDVN